MQGPIVVVLDASSRDWSAVPLAINLARRARVAVHLTQVLEPPHKEKETDTTFEDGGRGIRLSALVDICLANGVTAKTFLPEGDAVPEILRYIDQVQASLVITMTRVAPTLTRVFSGNAADTLIRFATAPVLVCSAHTLERPKEDLDRILVALDGSELAEHALHAVRGLAMDTDLVLMQAISASDSNALDSRMPLADGIANFLANQRRVAVEYLNRVADDLTAKGVRVSVAVREGAWPGRTIVEESLRQKVGLIAVATHGRTGFTLRALGSCAAEVLQLAPMPVLVAGPNLARSASSQGDASQRSNALVSS